MMRRRAPRTTTSWNLISIWTVNTHLDQNWAHHMLRTIVRSSTSGLQVNPNQNRELRREPSRMRVPMFGSGQILHPSLRMTKSTCGILRI